MDKATVLEIAKRYKEAVLKEFTPFKLMLFGSYANGNPHKHSDIDVAVVFDGLSDNEYIKQKKRLWDIAYGINSYLEPHLLDVKNDRSGFTAHILKVGEVV